MVAIDGKHNSWRHLVLPLATHDALVMEAVLAVSNFHWQEKMAGTYPSLGKTNLHPSALSPDEQYCQLVASLRQHKDLNSCGTDRIRSVLVTILLLLLCSMVNGQSDFPILYRMLEAALITVGGVDALGGTETDTFLKVQINKCVLIPLDMSFGTNTFIRIWLYGLPLLNEEAGFRSISSPTFITDLMKSLNFQMDEYPEWPIASAMIEELVRQAVQIYLDSFKNSRGSTSSVTTLVESAPLAEGFIQSLKSIPSGFPGERVIIWASYIAASSCHTIDHQDFFEGFLESQYKRSRFANVREGIRILRDIWSREPNKRWTLLIASQHVLIM